jgi:hypothetical protein
MQRSASLVLVAAVIATGCVLGPVELENKRCDADPLRVGLHLHR